MNLTLAIDMTLKLIFTKYFYDTILKMAAVLGAGKMAQMLKKQWLLLPVPT